MRSIFCLVLWTLSSSLFSMPIGFELKEGSAASPCYDHQGALVVDQCKNAIIHWESFSIDAHEVMRFNQADVTSTVLNRVMGKDISEIFGTLQSNGKLFLINPNGVLIGPTGLVNTAGFIASTLDVLDEDFFRGKELLFSGDGQGKVMNLGTIRCPTGDVYLIAQSVEDSGTILTKNGRVILAAGSKVFLQPKEEGHVSIRIEENVEDLQELTEQLSHEKNPYQKAIRCSGKVDALSSHKEKGRIYLVANKGEVDVEGQLCAEGGSICVNGEAVRLKKGAELDVSSKYVAGEILIGGGLHGKELCHTTASVTQVEEGVKIAADALEKGNGGKVVIWGDNQTTYRGHISAHGGMRTGDGGFVEISSKGNSYQFKGTVDLSANNGCTGRLLLDPKEAYIEPDGISPAKGNRFHTDPAGTVFISGNSISAALDTANVIIQVNNDLFVEDAITGVTPGNGITLQAGRSIEFESDGIITLNQAPFSATINDEGAVSANRDSGLAEFIMASESQIHTHGGDITLDVGTFDNVQEGQISLFGGNLDAGGGKIELTGYGSSTSATPFGLRFLDATLQTSGNGLISLMGTGGLASRNGLGISMINSQVTAANGGVSLIGQGGGDGTGPYQSGIVVSGSVISTTQGGHLTLQGTGGLGTDGNTGITVSHTSLITAEGGAQTFTGRGGGTGILNAGIRIDSGSDLSASGSGTVSFDGKGGSGTNTNEGVILTGKGTTIRLQDGSLSIVGEGGGTEALNDGIRLELGAQILSEGQGEIKLEGTAGDGVGCNLGVMLTGLDTRLKTTQGNILITGDGKGTEFKNQGIRIEEAQVISDGTGVEAASITLTGVGADGTNENNGVFITGETASVTTVDGNIMITGTGQGTGIKNEGVVILNPNAVQSTGDGTVTIVSHDG